MVLKLQILFLIFFLSVDVYSQNYDPYTTPIEGEAKVKQNQRSRQKPARPQRPIQRKSQTQVDTNQTSVQAPSTPLRRRPPRKRRRIPRRDYYFGSFSYFWLQETLDLLNKTTGEKSELRANHHGPCVGGGWIKFGRPFDYSLEGCGFISLTEVSTPSSNTTTYRQKDIQSFGLMVFPKIQYRSIYKAVALGIQTPIFLRYTEWEEGVSSVSSSVLTADPKLRYSAGLALDANWRYKRTVLHQKVGYIYGVGWMAMLQVDQIF